MNSKINIDAISKVIGEPKKDCVYFFDKSTFGILTLSLDNPDVSALKNLKDRIAKEPSRFPQIPKKSPHESYKEMEEFIKSVKDPKLSKRLLEAIEGQGAFKCFRDALEAYPREKTRWNNFKNEKLKKMTIGFLREIGIKYEESAAN